jgi:anaerobic selenocysteine-containing dehydrogenase
MGSEERVTFCRICEAYCGLVAEVDGGRLVRLRADKDHPLSRGYACPKGIAMAEVHNDPDRVLHPLRRRPDGGFERVSWRAAMADVGARARAVADTHGRDAIGWYMGNPGAFSYAHALWVKGLIDALGSPHHYTAGSQDVNNRFAASALMYGSPLVVPIPDIERTRLLLIIGANPLVSHGSLITTPRIREALRDVVARGGRVVVADPRRTETAAAFEHLPVRPDSDALLLLSLLHTIFDEGLDDPGCLRRFTSGAATLREWAAGFEPEATAARTGVPGRDARRLARDLAQADGAAVYGRTGSCLGRYGTLVAFLLDALNAVTGNLDRPGGAVFGSPPIALDEIGRRFGLASYARRRSRVGGFPDVIGNMPASLMAAEIEQPGPGRLRALFVSAGNPVLSVPDGEALERAFGQLDLLVSLDFYVNETNRHADYVLPATTFLERDDVPIASLAFHTTPFIQHTDAVLEPAGEARPEWEVVDELARALGVVPSPIGPLRLAGRLGIRPKPRLLMDLLLRGGSRNRLSLAKLRRHPHGLVLADHVATGVLRSKVRHRDRRVRLDPPEIGAEVRRLAADGEAAPDAEHPLRLIGLRELRSHNSWMHNAPKLMAGGRTHALRMHPDDARDAGLGDGDLARIASKAGSVEVPVRVTDEMMPGVVALPHGWGHRGGWRVANAAGGVNANALASGAPEDLEPLAGMAFLNGIPVRVSPVRTPSPAAPAAAAAP